MNEGVDVGVSAGVGVYIELSVSVRVIVTVFMIEVCTIPWQYSHPNEAFPTHPRLLSLRQC